MSDQGKTRWFDQKPIMNSCMGEHLVDQELSWGQIMEIVENLRGSETNSRKTLKQRGPAVLTFQSWQRSYESASFIHNEPDELIQKIDPDILGDENPDNPELRSHSWIPLLSNRNSVHQTPALDRAEVSSEKRDGIIIITLTNKRNQKYLLSTTTQSKSDKRGDVELNTQDYVWQVSGTPKHSEETRKLLNEKYKKWFKEEIRRMEIGNFPNLTIRTKLDHTVSSILTSIATHASSDSAFGNQNDTHEIRTRNCKRCILALTVRLIQLIIELHEQQMSPLLTHFTLERIGMNENDLVVTDTDIITILTNAPRREICY